MNERPSGPEREKRVSLYSIGHRGAAGHAPENTLRSIEQGLTLGADWIEVDVRRVGGEWVVFHDRHMGRITGVRGNLYRCDPACLRFLDAGGGERIPYLSEVLQVVRGRAGLDIELKDVASAEGLPPFVRASGLPEVLITSFLPEALRRIRRQDETIPLAPIAIRPNRRLFDLAHALGSGRVVFDARFATKRSMERLQASGVKAWVFTVNDPKRIEDLIRLGVEGIISDYPDRVVAVRNRLFASGGDPLP